MAAEWRARGKAHREQRLKEAARMLPTMRGNLESIFGRVIGPGEESRPRRPSEAKSSWRGRKSPSGSRSRGTSAVSSRRSSLAALRWSFLAGVGAAALSASSLVAWHFGFAPQLGRPLFRHAYAPTAVLRWAWDWWRDPAWRGEFLSALTDVAVVALVPVGIVRLLELQGRLPAWAGKAETGLGTPRDLVRTGRVAPHGEGVVLGSDGRRLYREVTKAHVLGIGSTNPARPPASRSRRC